MMFPRGWRSYGVGVGGRGAMTERRREDLIGWRVKKKNTQKHTPMFRHTALFRDAGSARKAVAGRQAGGPPR